MAFLNAHLRSAIHVPRGQKCLWSVKAQRGEQHCPVWAALPIMACTLIMFTPDGRFSKALSQECTVVEVSEKTALTEATPSAIAVKSCVYTGHARLASPDAQRASERSERRVWPARENAAVSTAVGLCLDAPRRRAHQTGNDRGFFAVVADIRDAEPDLPLRLQVHLGEA